MIASPFIL